MRLISLTLQGFKSFGDRTVLSFAPGVTAVVGPNGSGKSNLIEALRWTTGGGRAADYRAGEKTELIFHGASGKRSVSYAEVAIELQDGPRRHHIVRNMFRDGSSKLKLNGRTARFMDVEEVMGGSGLGRGSLAVIGQGEVGEVLMASSEKLLEYVAEAAGVAKLSSRRDLSLARLETAQGHLVRLADREDALTLEVSALEAEAQQAADHIRLSAEALRLRYTLAALRVASLQEEVTSLNVQRAELEAALTDGRRALAELQKAWSEARALASEHEAAYRDVLAEAEARRGDLRVAGERLSGLQDRLNDVKRESASITEEEARLTAATPPVTPDGALEDLQLAVGAAEERYTARARELAAAETALQDLRQRLEALRLEQSAEDQAAASHEAKKAQLLAQRAGLEERLASLPVQTGDDIMLRRELSDLNKCFKLAKTRYGALTEAVAADQGAHAQATAEEAALARAAERARQALAARRGFAQGPKHALASGIPGVFGAVADLIRVPEPYRVALASALGRRVEYIVVDTTDTAQAVLAHVKKRGGWVTVLPLDLVAGKPATLSPGLAGAPGVVGLASDLVNVPEEFKGIVFQLLGTTTLVETLQAGVALARARTARPRLISLEGDIIESYGALAGGQSRTPDSVLGAAAEVEDAEAAVEAARVVAAERLTALRARQTAAREAQLEMAALETSLTALRAQLGALEEARAVAQSLRAQVTDQLEALAVELGTLQPPQQRLDREALAVFQTRALKLAEEVSLLREKAAQAADALGEARQAVTVAEARWQRFAEQQRRFEETGERLERLKVRGRQLADLQVTLERDLAEANNALQIAQAAQPNDLEAKKAAWQAARLGSERLEAALSPLSESQAGDAENLERVKLSLARREAALELAQEDLAGFPVGMERVDGSARACRDGLGEVEAALEALGPVNHRAADELRDRGMRLEELRGQLTEARQAVDELSQVLETIDRETSARLSAATEALRRNFKHYVAELFGAEARAGVEILSEDGRPVGLSVALQPPGKQTTALNLLSVGERTMGALAFLFSLMQGDAGQRLPLAVLDEVDAPLDEANIRRFCAFLEQLAQQGTQFVLITHQKATFEIADVLWGVTSDQGVSRLFSIRREEAVV